MSRTNKGLVHKNKHLNKKVHGLVRANAGLNKKVKALLYKIRCLSRRGNHHPKSHGGKNKRYRFGSTLWV